MSYLLSVQSTSIQLRTCYQVRGFGGRFSVRVLLPMLCVPATLLQEQQADMVRSRKSPVTMFLIIILSNVRALI